MHAAEECIRRAFLQADILDEADAAGRAVGFPEFNAMLAIVGGEQNNPAYRGKLGRRHKSALRQKIEIGHEARGCPNGKDRPLFEQFGSGNGLRRGPICPLGTLPAAFSRRPPGRGSIAGIRCGQRASVAHGRLLGRIGTHEPPEDNLGGSRSWLVRTLRRGTGEGSPP